MLGFFSTLIVLIAVSSISIIVTGTLELDPELGPTFADSYQKNGPVYIKYDPAVFYKEFLYKTSLNTKLGYENGVWGLHLPYNLQFGINIEGYSFIHNNLIDLYTGNYMYPLLKDCTLPLNKTYLGHFEFLSDQSILTNLTGYKKYFGGGTLDIYEVLCNKNVFLPASNMADSLSVPFFEWYGSWANLDQFKIFSHFYFPLDRDIPSWVELSKITKTSFPSSCMLLDQTDWIDLSDSLTFSTIDFVENEDRLSLCSVDPSIWSNTYTQEQAMFRYYEPTTGVVGLWTPADLVLNYEIGRVSNLLEKKPEEVLAIFSNWLSPTGSANTLYFNFIETESFEWINDPWHDIGYVC